MLDQFFQNDNFNPGQMLTTHAKKPTIRRHNIYSEVAYRLNPKNPDRMQRLVRILEEAYSGYIHASYPHIMELYSSGDWKFWTNGVLDTPRHSEFIRALARSLPQALNQFAELANSLGFSTLFHELVQKRKGLEKSSLYR